MRVLKATAAGCVLLMATLVAAQITTRTNEPRGVVITEQPGRYVIQVDGVPFTEYRFGSTRVPYLYPVLAPGGLPVTRGAPMDPRPGEANDHPHHVSMWYAHGDVNGHDFWSGHETRIEHVDGRVENAVGAGPTLSVTNRWMHGSEVVCRERRTMQFAAGADQRTIDFRVTLQPATEMLVLGDTKEGTMAMRLAATLRLEGDVAAGHALNSAGVSGRAIWGKRAAWTAYTGPIGGEVVTVAMFDHPENPRHPTWWHARAYGLFAANPFGRRAFEKNDAVDGRLVVAVGESVAFRYRVLVSLGALDAAALDTAWTVWSGVEVPAIPSGE